jgi:cytochrome c553
MRPALPLAGALLLIASLHGAPAAAQETPPPPASDAPVTRSPAALELDDPLAVERGRAVATGVYGGDTARGGVTLQACMTCHGMDGRGDGSAAFPRLTGQSAWYLYKQLVDYAAGTRPNDVMSPIAKVMTEAQMQDVAIYYAMQDAPSFPPRQHDPLLVQEGGALSAVGSTERQIQGCVNCHGPSGTGLPPVYPYLAGQYGGYVRLQLELWQQGVRRNDPLGVMAVIAKSMTSRDIEAVGAYFETVRVQE